jgi:NAD(P)H-dependent FMN reductase
VRRLRIHIGIMEKKKIGIIVGSTREGRISKTIAEWAQQEVQKVSEYDIVLLDLADYPLPFFGEPDTKKAITSWEQAVRDCNGFIFVTPEYNHSITGVLKNALDFAYNDWDKKVAGIISYGFGANGARAAEHLRGILGALGVVDVKTHILLSLFDDMENKIFKPRNLHIANIKSMIENISFYL